MTTKWEATVNVAMSGQTTVVVTAETMEEARNEAVREVMGDAQVANIEKVDA